VVSGETDDEPDGARKAALAGVLPQFSAAGPVFGGPESAQSRV
jgi:hypothetical protein